MEIYRYSDSLYLIDLPQKIPGFRNFISSWVYFGENTYLVDPGPKSSIYHLVDSLKEIGAEKIDYILITHIHIDHAGGTGELLKHFRDAKIIVNEKGRKHLVNPEKLWEGSLKVLGDIAVSYGEIVPVNPSGFAESAQGVEIIHTPGHAVHHQSYVVDEYLFAGEALGVYHEFDDGVYQRPATPPKFVYEIAYNSIQKLRKYEDRNICFGHFGMSRNGSEIISRFQKQLKTWVQVVEGAIAEFGENFESVLETSRKRLMEIDESFSHLEKFDDETRRREEYFFRNAILGMYQYVLEKRA